MTPAGLFATTAALLLASTAASAVELPKRKTGLWEIRIKITGGMMPTAKMYHCTDAGMDWKMSTLFNPMAQNPCPQFDVQKIEDHYTVESTCRAGDKTVTQHSKITGDFNTHYTVVMERGTKETETSEPAMSNMTLDGSYVGNCKPDQKPGDVIMAGGMKVNVRDLEQFLKSKR